MDRILIVIALSLLGLSGCTKNPYKPIFDEIQYDFQTPSVYEMSNRHKRIHVALDAPDLTLPETSHRMPSLLLEWTEKPADAQFVLYIRFSDSFLIERISGIRTDVEFDEDGRGRAFDTPIQRGFIRTHYTIELVDVPEDKLVNQFQGASNYAIEAPLVKTIQENKRLLRLAFQDELGVARYQVLTEIWKKVKTEYLSDLQVTFGKQTYQLVSELEQEPDFLAAFDLLSENNKAAAKKALKVYNDAMKRYSPENSDTDPIRKWLDQGITAASAIANSEHEDRYPPE